jgi:hypothetical protein
MAVEDLQITGVELLPDGVQIAYVRVPKDVRKNGLVWQHQVFVPFSSDYDEEMTEVTDALLALLKDVLDDEDRAEPIDLTEEEDEEEDDDE